MAFSVIKDCLEILRENDLPIYWRDKIQILFEDPSPRTHEINFDNELIYMIAS